MSGFTIVIPVHNGGVHLRASVASVLAQRYADFELLVLDNASTDGSREFVAGVQDPRVRLVTSTAFLPIELSWARILQTRRREFMTILGHDDVLDPDYLDTFERLIRRHPEASLYQAHFRLINAQDQRLQVCRPMPERESAAEFLAMRLNNLRESFGTGYMMRSADYDAVGGIPPFSHLLNADDALWIMLTARSYKATAFEECFSYRVHRASTSGSATREAGLAGLTDYLRFLAEMRERNAEVAAVLDRYGSSALKDAIRAMYGGVLHQDCRRDKAQRRAAGALNDLTQLYRVTVPKAPIFSISSPMIKLLEGVQSLPDPARRLFHPLWRGAQELRWRARDYLAWRL